MPGQGDDLFKIDLNSGLVLTKILLDESTVGCYLLYIEARNPDAPLLNDNATVQICVTEQFGINPHFSLASYNFTVVENQPAGQQVTHTHACTYSYNMCVYATYCICCALL